MLWAIAATRTVDLRKNGTQLNGITLESITLESIELKATEVVLNHQNDRAEAVTPRNFR